MQNLHCAWPVFRPIKRDIYVVGDINSTFNHLATGINTHKKKKKKKIRHLPFNLIV